MRVDALLFDFDGVLLESEWAGNKQIADWLTRIGHPTSVEDSMREFMGLAGLDFIGAIERWIGRAVPDDFHAARAEEDARAIAEGIEEVAGAVRFIRGRRPGFPGRSLELHPLESRASRHLGLRRRSRRILRARHVERGSGARSLLLPRPRSACLSAAPRSSRIPQSACRALWPRARP